MLNTLVGLSRGKRELKMSIAAVGRVMGMSRSGAWQRFRRLEAACVCYRVGRVIYFNIQGFIRWLKDAAKKRVLAISRSIHRKNRRNVKQVKSHIHKKVSKKEKGRKPLRPSAPYDRAQATMTPEQRELYWCKRMGVEPLA